MAYRQGAKDRSQIVLCLFLVFLSCGYTSAGLLNWRRDDALDAENGAIVAASGPATTDDAAASSSLTSTGPATASATPTGTGAAAAASETAATATLNSTTISNSTSTAAAAASSDFSSPLNSTNDPHRCYKDLPGEGLGNPFCKPPPGQTIQVDKDFEVTWDPSLFESNSTNIFKLRFLKSIGSEETDEIDILKETALNSQGSTYLSLSSSSLNGSSTANLTLILENAEHPNGMNGPNLIFAKANRTSSSSSSSNKKLGEKVGIPIGLVFLIAVVALIAAFLFLRKRRRGGGGGLGYGASSKSARSQRMAAAGGGDAPATATRGHRRDPSFHDEPTRGMELQNRNAGGTGEDNWDWGSPVSSPTTVGGRNSNAFRDEIQRQRSGKRA